MKFRAVGVLLAISALLSGCLESEAEKAEALMNPKEDGSYVLISTNPKRPPVVYKVIRNGTKVINLEADWIGLVPTGVMGMETVLTQAACGQISISSVDGRLGFFYTPGSSEMKAYERCGLGGIPLNSWEFRVDKSSE
ncbi:MAG: hypothetical protein E6R09_00925 [Rhodocyclaceae bacterium]|nr:MAG: hypothetical protein E6R09_00925 [Rhodocyclaceae bacterium]